MQASLSCYHPENWEISDNFYNAINLNLSIVYSRRIFWYKIIEELILTVAGYHANCKDMLIYVIARSSKMEKQEIDATQDRKKNFQDVQALLLTNL